MVEAGGGEEGAAFTEGSAQTHSHTHIHRNAVAECRTHLGGEAEFPAYSSITL